MYANNSEYYLKITFIGTLANISRLDNKIAYTSPVPSILRNKVKALKTAYHFYFHVLE